MEDSDEEMQGKWQEEKKPKKSEEVEVEEDWPTKKRSPRKKPMKDYEDLEEVELSPVHKDPPKR